MKPKIEAYLEQIHSGRLESTNTKVLNYIYRSQGATIEEMRTELGIAHQTLTSSISHLCDMGVIYPYEVKQGTDRRYTLYKYEADREKQQINARFVHQEKFEKLKTRMLTEFADCLTEYQINALNEVTGVDEQGQMYLL